MSDSQLSSPAGNVITEELPSQIPTTASATDALNVAGTAAGFAGADSKVASALDAAAQATDIVQGLGDSPIDAALAAADPVSMLAGKAPAMPNPMNLAGGKLPTPANALNAAVKQALGSIRAEPSYLAQHPLAGKSVNDLAAKLPPFAPSLPSLDDFSSDLAAALNRLEQDTRLLRFYGPLAGDKKLFAESLRGESTLSEPYAYRLRLLAEDGNIALKEMLAKNVTMSVELQDESQHPINGYVSQFAYTHSDGGLAYYEAEIVPWLWYLNHRVNSRIYQDLSVIDVIQKVFDENYNGLASYELRLSGTYQPENYIVQYDESDFAFVSRLMEHYGLFYFFEHADTSHVMVITDDSCDNVFCPPQAAHPEVKFNAGSRTSEEDSVTRLTAERTFQSSQVALNTFDFKAPSSPMYVELPTVAQQGEVPKLEVYHGNPAFAYKTKSDGEQDARLRMEAIECRAKTFNGTSECRGLIAGHSFKLHKHFWFDGTDATDNDFLVTSVAVEAHNNLGRQTHADSYQNTFTCIRRKVPYRAQRLHQKPTMKGPQSATVVGPAGAEIHTDEFGRIKVQFPWDRYGRFDDRSSCWIRVSQPWAGKNWGTVAIPRIGQEVMIDFLEGDPDRPVCTGRLFNTEQPPPYNLPAGAHQMGFRSRSTPGGGGHCEIVIHDQAGEELINIHSQKDMVTTVQNNQQTIVNGPERMLAVTEGRYTAAVKQEIAVESETAHVHIKADTNATVGLSDDHLVMLDKESGTISLVVGQSSITMTKDGAISIDSKSVQINAPNGIFLNC